LENTFGRRLNTGEVQKKHAIMQNKWLTCHLIIYLLDRNSKIGTAICVVAESFDIFNKTSGNNFTITSLISNIQVVNAITTGDMHRLTNPK